MFINSKFNHKITMKDKIFFEHDDLKIINDDVLTTNEIEKNSIDLIVTSPPYNVDIKYNSHDDRISYKNQWKKNGGRNISDITKEEFIEWTNGLWTFRGESKKRVGHPAPFPIE